MIICSPLLASVRHTGHERGDHGNVLAIFRETALHLLPELGEDFMELVVCEFKVRVELCALRWQRHDERYGE